MHYLFCYQIAYKTKTRDISANAILELPTEFLSILLSKQLIFFYTLDPKPQKMPTP